MPISRARRNFRFFLGVLLLISLGFFSVSAYYYTSVKQHKIKLSTIAPTLFQIDIYHYYAMSYLQNKDEQFLTARKLYGKGIFDATYTKAGDAMMQTLADNGHPPSQVFQADILMMYADTQEDKDMARQYYENAADQGYNPAIEKLAFLLSQQ